MGFDPETGYWTLREILGYNCKYNIVLSERGIGKSYGTKGFLLRQPGESMCLYRQQPDMAHAVKVWLQDVGDQGFDLERFRWEGSDQTGWILFMDDAPKIWFRFLTATNHIKQESFPETMDWLWLDEFIPLIYKKLPGVDSEGDAIRVIAKTIEHDTVHSRQEKGLRPLRVLMYANPFTWNNPILSYFHVLPKGYGVHRIGPGIVCEMVKPLDVPESGPQTADDFLGNEVHRNQGWADSAAFVRKVTKGAVPTCIIRMGSYRFIRWQLGGSQWIEEISGDRYPEIPHLGDYEGLQESELPITQELLNSMKREVYLGHMFYVTMNSKFDYMRCVNDMRA